MGDRRSRAAGINPSVPKPLLSRGQGYILTLHLAVFFVSFAGVLGKLASQVPVWSAAFALRYGLMIGLLAAYALIWQRILTRVDLSIAYSLKSLSVVWGMVWAVLFFQESLRLNNLVGAGLIILGVLLVGPEPQ